MDGHVSKHCKQKHPHVSNLDESDDYLERRFTTVFKKWIQHQNTVTLAIEVPKEKEEEVRQKLKELGLKVI